MILFLDFDGVTHPVSGTLPFQEDCIEAITTAVTTLNAEIVISSSWRLEFVIDDLREFLGPYLGNKVIGITPDLNVDPFIRWPRAREVSEWIENNYSHDKPWAAIDDEEGNYPEGYSYIANRRTGFTNKDVEPFIVHARLDLKGIQYYLIIHIGGSSDLT